MHTHFFYFSIFYFFLFFFIFLFFIFYVFWGLGLAQPMWGLGWTQPARSLAQANDLAGPKQTGGTRGVSPPVHALCEGN